MATTSRRADLEIHGVLGMLRQAAFSFRASLSLVVTIALLSTSFKSVTHSGLVSVSAQRANSSLTQTTNYELQTGAVKRQDSGTTTFSRFLASLLEPKDRALHSEGATGIHSDMEDSGELNHGASPSTSRDEGFQSNEDNTHAQKTSQMVVVQEDGTASEKDLAMHGSGRIEDSAVSDKLQRSHNNGHSQRKRHDGIVKTVDNENLVNDMFETDEDAGTNFGLPQLRIEVVSNETKRSPQESVVDTFGLSFFTSKLLGEQRLDQGDVSLNGTAVLIFGLVLIAVLALLFVVLELHHAMVLGSVAYSVVTTHMGKTLTVRRALWCGLKSGVRHLILLSFFHLMLRTAQVQIFMKALFGGMMEAEQVEQLSRRLSTLPFSVLAPFKEVTAEDPGMAIRIGLFVGLDNGGQGVAYCIYVIACWVLIIEKNRRVFGALSRSCHLIKAMLKQAIVIRVLEAVLCGPTSRWLLRQAIGEFATDFFLSLAQSYFLVVWLIFYLSARSVQDLLPSHFSYRTLEDYLDRFK